MLKVERVTKKFGDFKANDDVSLEIKPGEIHALLGENGAGKSTLVKMIYGSLQPTSGQFFWNDAPLKVETPSQARATGIGMVFQHFSLFDSLSVSDNIELSLDASLDRSRIRQNTIDLSTKYGLPLNPDAIVGDLSVGERQRVEIIRCLLQNPKLIILDEPTSVLTPAEADTLFKTLFRLKDEGRSILYISHKLEEVKTLCDDATILRFGKVVAECDPKKESAVSLASLMVGGDISDIKKVSTNSVGTEPLLKLKNASLGALTPFATALSDINLSVSGGEVLGIAGVAGNGQSELFDIISGEITLADNSGIEIRNTACGKNGINARRKLGATFAPEERLGHSAVAALKLSENLLLSRHASDAVGFLRFGKLGVIWKNMLQRATTRICEAMDVRKTGGDPYGSSLSGGNLQKFIMGRELDRQPSVFVVNQPTWGVDAGAAARIRQSMIDLAESGSAVVVISQDLDEIFEISDKISVMSEGRISEPEPVAVMNRDKIGLLMAGISVQSSKVEAANAN